MKAYIVNYSDNDGVFSITLYERNGCAIKKGWQAAAVDADKQTQVFAAILDLTTDANRIDEADPQDELAKGESMIQRKYDEMTANYGWVTAPRGIVLNGSAPQ